MKMVTLLEAYWSSFCLHLFVNAKELKLMPKIVFHVLSDSDGNKWSHSGMHAKLNRASGKVFFSYIMASYSQIITRCNYIEKRKTFDLCCDKSVRFCF